MDPTHSCLTESLYFSFIPFVFLQERWNVCRAKNHTSAVPQVALCNLICELEKKAGEQIPILAIRNILIKLMLCSPYDGD